MAVLRCCQLESGGESGGEEGETDERDSEQWINR